MDISFNMDNMRFNYRVAAVIRKGNEILVEQKQDVNYLGLPGGRVKIGESSIQALKREMMEEMGINLEYVQSKMMIENFYISKYTKGPCHEILMILEMKFDDKKSSLKEEFINQEEAKNAVFKWINIDILKTKKFKPEVFLDYIDEKEFKHIINRD